MPHAADNVEQGNHPPIPHCLKQCSCCQDVGQKVWIFTCKITSLLVAKCSGSCMRTAVKVTPLQVGAVARLGFVVCATFACIWAPFVVPPSRAVGVLSRLAPLRRGLFEDYVGNFWCATSPLIKWKRLFSQQVCSKEDSYKLVVTVQDNGAECGFWSKGGWWMMSGQPTCSKSCTCCLDDTSSNLLRYCIVRCCFIILPACCCQMPKKGWQQLLLVISTS